MIDDGHHVPFSLLADKVWKEYFSNSSVTLSTPLVSNGDELVNILSGIPVPVHNKEIGNIYSDDALSW
jgi:hypothetical protein